MSARRLALLVGLSLSACSDDPGDPIDPPTNPDGVPPEVAILFPATDIDWDTDADGLMDVYISWSDEAGVDASTFRLDVVDQDGESLPGAFQLTDAWTIVEETPTGLWIEETVESRLPAGTWSLRASVEDSTGTPGGATAGEFTLHSLELHRAVPVGAGLLHGLSYCPARDEVYVYGEFIAVVDAETFEMQARELPVHEAVSGLTCSGASPLAVTDRDLAVLSLETLAWVDADGPPGIVDATVVLPGGAPGRFHAAAYRMAADTGWSFVEFDAATGAVTPLFPLPEAVDEASVVGSDLFLGSASGLSVFRNWATGTPTADPWPVTGGTLRDLEGRGDQLLTLAQQPDGSYVEPGTVTLPRSGGWWLDDVTVVDVALSAGGDIFAAATTACDSSVGACEAVDAFAFVERCDWAGCVDRVPVPFVSGMLAPGDQSAFRADGAMLFWAATDGDTPTLYVYLHRDRP